MPRRLRSPDIKITITIPKELVDRLDELVEEFEEYVSRSEVIAEIVDYVLDEEAILEEIFPSG
jgi:metal-responsive CopG/Arc/MetJ family transcriptional regulator